MPNTVSLNDPFRIDIVIGSLSFINLKRYWLHYWLQYWFHYCLQY